MSLLWMRVYEDGRWRPSSAYKKTHHNLRIPQHHLSHWCCACSLQCIPCVHCSTPIVQAEMGAHEGVCPMRPVTCPNPGCGSSLLFKDLEAHKHHCEWRLEVCPYCSVQIVFRNMDDHKHSKCPNRPVPCPWCKKTFSKQETQAHQAHCTERPVQCPTCHKDVPRSQQSMHAAGCALIQKANLLLPRLRPVCGIVIDVTPGDDAVQDGGVLVVPYSKDGAINPKPGFPGALAGIVGGDRIQMLGTATTMTNNQFKGALTRHRAGDKVDVRVNRGSSLVTCQIEIGGLWVNPHNPKDQYMYPKEEVAILRRIAAGDLKEGDARANHTWMQHATICETAGEALSNTWTTTRRSSTKKITRHFTTGEMGMTARARSAR